MRFGLFLAVGMLSVGWLWGQSGREVQVLTLTQKAGAVLDEQPDTAFVYAQRALQLAEKQKDIRGQAEAHALLGKVFYQQAVFRSAIEHLLAALEGYRKAAEKRGMADTYNLLGLAYYYSLEPALARKNHETALSLYETLGDVRGRAETYGWLGHLAEKNKNYPQAIAYQQMALELYLQIKDNTGIGKIYENLGSIQEDFEDYENARMYFLKALEYSRLSDDDHTVANVLNNIGDTYRKQGRLAEALRYTREACDLARSHELQYLLRSALKDLAKTYALMGDYPRAHACLDSSYTLYELIYDDESARQLARMQTIYETEKKNQEILTLEHDTFIFKIWIVVIPVFLLILGLLAFFYLRQARIRQQNEAQRKEQEHLLLAAQFENTRLNEQKLNAEIENQQLREQQLQADLALKSRELTSYALQVVQKNRFLEEMKEQLIEIKKSEKDKGKMLVKLIHSIDHNFKQDQDWEDFKRTFEQIHPDFFHKLQTTWPDLSGNDLRICALLKLNLASPDIATLLGISQDSFRTARYRLRKKMGIEERASLRALIMSIG